MNSHANPLVPGNEYNVWFAKWRPWFEKRIQESQFMYYDFLTELHCP